MFALRSYFPVFSLILVAFTSVNAHQQEPSFSEVTVSALEQAVQLNKETRRGGSLSLSLVRCSQFQDVFLSYLLNVDNDEEYYQGMELIQPKTDSFYSNCKYCSDSVNFFNPGADRFLTSQGIPVEEGVYGYLNTFKTGSYLTAQQREEFYLKESEHYQRDAVVYPFTLDEETLKTLEPETIYNFALLEDGTIRVGLEEPGRHVYYVQGEEEIERAFTHPNHTILAGSPHQVLLSAGALLFYEKDGRRLYFISNKSGHFAPYFFSLPDMVKAMEKLGVNQYTVKMVPDLDIAAVAVKHYIGVQVPIALQERQIRSIYNNAYQRWSAVLKDIDPQLFKQLSCGTLEALSSEDVDMINRWRDEATYMRAAYQLFCDDHQMPKKFHQFVKQLGKLKDAIRHDVRSRIPSEAALTLELFEQTPFDRLSPKNMAFADEASLSSYLTEKTEGIKKLLNHTTLPVEFFHDVKKWSRELGVLFMWMAEDVRTEGNGYFLYRATSDEFFHINGIMAETHDNCVGDAMLGKHQYDDINVNLDEKIKTRFERLFARIRIPPIAFTLDIPDDDGFWLINCAKEWYTSHFYMTGISKTNYDERPKKLLEKIASGEFHGIDSEDDEIAKMRLLQALNDAEYASAALLFIDKTHSVDEEIITYIQALSAILHWIDYGGAKGVVEEVEYMLEFLNPKGRTPSLQLEKYICTDQASLNATVAGRLDLIRELTLVDTLNLDKVLEIQGNIRLIRDILEIYRHAGPDNQSYPTVCYDQSKQAAQKLLNGLQAATLPHTAIDPILVDHTARIVITQQMKEEAAFLLEKLGTT